MRNCPFCDLDNIELNWSPFEKPGTVYFMECKHCGCKGPWLHFKEDVAEDQKEKACIVIWNDRFGPSVLR
jgi:Rieske Fe-S protein